MKTRRTELPLKDSPEGKQIIERYKKCNTETVKELAKELGYASAANLHRAMHSVYGEPWNPLPLRAAEVAPPKVIIPEIVLKEYIPKKGRGGAETQGLILGDLHLGEETPTFNSEIADTRLNNLFQSSVRIADLHRHIYPVDDIVVLMLGDMIHGENPKQGAKVGVVKMGAVDQVYELALPKMLSLLYSLRENFRTVSVYCVPGNHGRISVDAPETSNYDNILYRTLAESRLPSGIEVYPSKEFYQLVTIRSHRFFIHHGDSVRMTQGIPYFAQTRKIMSWYITYGGFDYSVSGHWHKDDFYRVSAKTKQINNGALVSDDPFALRVIGTSSVPSQSTFGVHDRRGITWYYSLTLEG